MTADFPLSIGRWAFCLAIVLATALPSAAESTKRKAARPTIPPAALQAFEQGQAAYRSGSHQEAVRHYRQSIALAPGFGGAHFNLGLVLHDLNQPEQALQAFLDARKLDPSIAPVDLFIGIEQFTLRRFDKARTFLERASKRMPGNPEPLIWLGKSCLEAGNAASAIQALESARKLDGKNPSVLYSLGQAYSELSSEAYKRMYETAPDSHLVDIVLAQAAVAQKNYDEALFRYRKALGKQPQTPGLHEAIGAIHFERSEFADATREFQRELAIDANNPGALTRLGMIQVHQGQYQAGIDHLRRSAEIAPQVAATHAYLGRGLLRSGNLQDALASLKTAARLQPTDPSVHHQLWQLYRKLDNAAEAERELAIFRELSRVQQDQARMSSDKKSLSIPVALREAPGELANP